MSLPSETTIELQPCEIVGPPGAPAVVALGGISANRHVCASVDDPAPGWWEALAGDGRALDTKRYRVVGFDFLDGGRDADGRPRRIVTTHDQADALAAALDGAGIERAHAVVGASYGGMVALALAERYPAKLERLVVIGAAHRPHAMTTALRSIQRRIVELGIETGRTHDALVLARALAMTTYRTAAEFAARFDAAVPEPGTTAARAVLAVEEYLLRQGERFAARFTPERFLALSLSSDLHRVAPARIRTPTVLVAAQGDTNVPREQMEELAREIGGPCRLVDLPSTKGHDAFLTEAGALGQILQTALS